MNATVSSRTPEGVPGACHVCGAPVCVEPSWPPGDAPCPRCGALLWFTSREESRDHPREWGRVRSVPRAGHARRRHRSPTGTGPGVVTRLARWVRAAVRPARLRAGAGAGAGVGAEATAWDGGVYDRWLDG